MTTTKIASDQTAILLEALNRTGPQVAPYQDWQSKLMNNVTFLMETIGPNSKAAIFAQQMAESRVLFGTVESCVREDSSKRGLATFAMRPTKYSKNGMDTIRTDICGDPGDPGPGYEMAKFIRSLVGHRVMVWIRVEMPRDAGPDDKGVRVITHVKDLGMPKT